MVMAASPEADAHAEAIRGACVPSIADHACSRRFAAPPIARISKIGP